MHSKYSFFGFLIIALNFCNVLANSAINLINEHEVIVNKCFQRAPARKEFVIIRFHFRRYCVKAKDLLSKEGIPVHVVEMDRLPNGGGNKLFQEIFSLTNQRTVPNIFMNGNHIGGYDSISKLQATGLLKSTAKK